ncbi:MAG: endoribonuclease MazF [Acidobacteria bacterium]|nr:MAG: endoribonuclease MazF [Acidobacteriota bacterium]
MVSRRPTQGYVPDAGHIVKVDLDPRVGHEQGGWRPALVLSPRSYNGKTGLAVMVPITNQAKGYPFEVLLPKEGKTTGVILADAIRSLDWLTRHARYVETARSEVLRAVQMRLMELLGFSSA